jgi:hypothetical protein
MVVHIDVGSLAQRSGHHCGGGGGCGGVRAAGDGKLYSLGGRMWGIEKLGGRMGRPERARCRALKYENGTLARPTRTKMSSHIYMPAQIV